MSSRKHTPQPKLQTNTNKITNHSRASRRAAFALMAIATTSSVDTIHAFSESFPQHMTAHGLSIRHTPTVHAHTQTNTNHAATTFASQAPTFLSNRLHHNGDDAPHATTSTALFYAQNPHTTKTAPMVAQAFYSSYKTNRNPTKPRNSSSSSTSMPLSNSVLMSSDTLPAFPTAHGLLSPETVMRMELTTPRGRDHAVDFFLDTYRKEGPMACLPLLSDQEVLPRLTQAMRDIIA